MTAVLPVRVPVGCKGLPTVFADESVIRLAVYQVEMAVPPMGTTTVAAKLSGLSAGNFYKALAATLAKQIWVDCLCGCGYSTETIPFAKGLDCVIVHAHVLCNCPVAASILAKFNDGGFLFIRHIVPPDGVVKNLLLP